MDEIAALFLISAVVITICAYTRLTWVDGRYAQIDRILSGYISDIKDRENPGSGPSGESWKVGTVYDLRAEYKILRSRNRRLGTAADAVFLAMVISVALFNVWERSDGTILPVILSLVACVIPVLCLLHLIGFVKKHTELAGTLDIRTGQRQDTRSDAP